MQWLIDIIKELIHGQLGYFNRGDPNSFDFIAVNFTRDNAWHVLDLSAIVPANAQAVSIYCIIRSTLIHRQIQFRSKDITNDYNKAITWTQVANIRLGFPFTVAVDSDRAIEYKVQGVDFNLINFTISGWWLR